MVGRNFSRLPSELWGIEDPGIALDFNRACSLRLTIFDCEMRKAQAEALAPSSGASAPFGTSEQGVPIPFNN